jgi:DNA-binding response OmpR family regulator
MRKATRAAVLVVDDDASVRSSLDRSFRRAGYDVHLADSSDSAFQVIDVSCPDIVLLDVMMPGGVEG